MICRRQTVQNAHHSNNINQRIIPNTKVTKCRNFSSSTNWKSMMWMWMMMIDKIRTRMYDTNWLIVMTVVYDIWTLILHVCCCQSKSRNELDIDEKTSGILHHQSSHIRKRDLGKSIESLTLTRCYWCSRGLPRSSIFRCYATSDVYMRISSHSRTPSVWNLWINVNQF